MRRVTRLSAALALAALLGAAPAAAIGPVAEGLGPEEEARAHLERGDQLVAEGKFSAARSSYEKAAKIIRSDGELPTEALRRIANAYYFEGRLQSAAHVLDDLASEAAAFGDLPTQAWALADGAWVYGKLGSAIGVNRRVERLERLLSSPYLPESVRDRIAQARLGEETTLGLR